MQADRVCSPCHSFSAGLRKLVGRTTVALALLLGLASSPHARGEDGPVCTDSLEHEELILQQEQEEQDRYRNLLSTVQSLKSEVDNLNTQIRELKDSLVNGDVSYETTQ